MPSHLDDDDGEEEEHAFANPQMPSRYRVVHGDDDDDGGRQKLSNDDFRKLMMTPRAPTSDTPKPSVVRHNSQTEEEDAATRRRKKKAFYAKLKKKEEEERKELEQRYRDRAKERRDQEEGGGPPGSSDPIKTTADYKAVAPDAKSNQTLAERRRLAIQESKYLGGDMEHTHLVKGLDYALLEKVRTEISSKENEEDDQMEDALQTKKEEEDPESRMQFNTIMARNIFRVMFRRQLPERNELFAPRRMAYVVDLEDEFAESDIPTTLLRSKADCPNTESSTTLSTNDIIINKLTQILSYLRQGDRKLKKKEKGKMKEEERVKHADDSIYADVGNYVPSYSKSKTKKDRDDDGHDRRDRDRGHSDRDRSDRDRGDRRDRRHDRERRSYFEKPAEEDEDSKRSMPSAKEFVRSINERFASQAPSNWADTDQPEGRKPEKGDKQMEKIRAKTEINSYAECYPGMMESADAIDDSDEETDYTKMDQGNKKGPVGRWDFETQEEYSDYMSNKEAMPKAAFQYGVKMADGRRTRRAGPKDEKKELDREWQQIQNIISKRKNMGAGGEPVSKSARH